MKIKINEDACICCGTCYNSFDNIYDSNDEGKAIIKKEPETEEELEEAVQGLSYCPVEAIEIEGLEGGCSDCSSCPGNCGH